MWWVSMEGGTMCGSRWLFLVGCLVVSVAGTSAATAGGSGTLGSGTITFVGALVEPTCSVSTAADVEGAFGHAGEPQLRRRSCSATGSATADASRTYSSSVVHLSDSEPDQVLRYFAGYVRAGQAVGADPVLVTQTYD
jgi:hypothetical protein